MGKYERLRRLSPDALAKNFWKSNERFADLFNAVVYRRRQIDPSSLREMDTDISALIADKDLLETIRRVRDTVKLSADGVQYQILAIEKKSDRLVPCRTVVVYYGSKPWDGARNLSELMEFSTYRSGGRNCLEALKHMDVEVAYTAAAVTGTMQAYGKEIEKNMDKGMETIDMCEVVE